MEVVNRIEQKGALAVPKLGLQVRAPTWETGFVIQWLDGTLPLGSSLPTVYIHARGAQQLACNPVPNGLKWRRE